MRPLALLACSLLVLACSDDDADPTMDGGGARRPAPDASSMTPDASRGDAGRAPDAGGQVEQDAGKRPDARADSGSNSGCAQLELDDFQLSLEDDVSVRYAAEVTPRIDKTLSLLEILFERYVPGPDTGTFELGGDGPDGNYGGCAHCVAIPGIAPEYAYFADRGTLVIEADPYDELGAAQPCELRGFEFNGMRVLRRRRYAFDLDPLAADRLDQRLQVRGGGDDSNFFATGALARRRSERKRQAEHERRPHAGTAFIFWR